MKLILLPGMDGTGLLFAPLLEALPSWLQCKVVTYPAREPLGYAELLPWVRDACPSAAEFVVLAESFSGPLALMLAASEPPGLRGIILCASFIRCRLLAPLRWMAGAAHPIWFQMAPTWPARWALLGRHGTDRLKRLFGAAAAAVNPEVMAARARAIASVDVSGELRSTRVPLLYLAARQDRVVGPSCRITIRRIKPDIDVAMLPGPHLLLQACPVEAAYEVGQFIKRVMPGPNMGLSESTLR